MRRRPLGRTGLSVSEIGFGGGRLASATRGGTDREAIALVGEAFDRGITFFDTADSYGQGKSEELIGRALRGTRDSVVIASKTGYRYSSTARYAALLKPVLRPLVRSLRSLGRSAERIRSSQVNQDFSPEYVRAAVEGSLRRLGTDRIDLYQLHSPPGHVVRTGGAFAVFDELKQQGKILHYGVACLTVEDAVACLAHPGVAAVQVALNLLETKAVHDLLPLAREQGCAVVARQPLAAGRLIGGPASRSAVGEAPERPPRTRDGWRFLEIPGSRTLAQAAIQFVLSNDGVSTVLVGTTSTQHLREDVEALAAPPLSAEEMASIERFSAG